MAVGAACQKIWRRLSVNSRCSPSSYPTTTLHPPAASTWSCTAALRGRLAWKSLCVPLPGTCDMDASPLGSGPPDTVINGTCFSPHLILLLSELSGPKTIINSQSSVNPLTRSFHPTRFPLPNEKKRKRDGVGDGGSVHVCLFFACVCAALNRQMQS